MSIFMGIIEVPGRFTALAGRQDDPIKGFGLRTDYAGKRLMRATGVGRDKILSSMPQLLSDPVGITTGMRRSRDVMS